MFQKFDLFDNHIKVIANKNKSLTYRIEIVGI